MNLPRKGCYRHFKGGEYELLYIARHSETDEPMVVYRALYPCPDTPNGEGIWARPLASWNRPVEIDGRMAPRFALIETAALDGQALCRKTCARQQKKRRRKNSRSVPRREPMECRMRKTVTLFRRTMRRRCRDYLRPWQSEMGRKRRKTATLSWKVIS